MEKGKERKGKDRNRLFVSGVAQKFRVIEASSSLSEIVKGLWKDK